MEGHGYSKWSESHSVMSSSLWPHGLYSPRTFPGQNTGVGSLSLLQGIFPTQGLNPDLLHCRQILLLAEPQGKPKNVGVDSLSLLQQIFLTEELNQGLLHCRQILCQLSYQGSPLGGTQWPRVIWECVCFTRLGSVRNNFLNTYWLVSPSPHIYFTCLAPGRLFQGINGATGPEIKDLDSDPHFGKNHPSDCVSLLRLLVMEPWQSMNTQSLGLQTTLRLTRV